MNNANRTRKNRSSSARGGRGKGADRQLLADGVYTNHRFMQSVGALVGLPVLIQTKTNDTIEGVFTTVSPHFDLVLDMAHPVTRSDSSIVNPEHIKRKMIFAASDIVTIKVNNVDLEYATKEGFAVDHLISRFNGQVTERALEPWQGDVNADDITLGEESSNGWDVADMFRKNEEKYGVTTSYTPEMEGYTTPLQRRNDPEYRKIEAKAQRIAAEILNSPTTQVRSEAENGDEEDRFSAVIRPADQAASGGSGASKYVPPMLRKNQNSGKLMRSTPPPGPGSRYNRSNPTTPTSPSCTGPPQVPSGSHSPIGGPSGPVGPGYPPQQGPPPSTHSPSPAANPPLHRHNSHSHPNDSKVNGDAKGSYDRRNHHDNSMNDPGRENHHNDTGVKQDHHVRQQHSEVQKGQQKPPPQHQQHQGHMPPMGQGDHRKQQEPREQREPRKQRTNKEEQFADLKKFHQDFKLSEQADKKAQGQQQPPQQQQHQQIPQQMQQPPEPQQVQPPQQQQQPQQQQPPQQPSQPQHPQQPPPPQTRQPPPPSQPQPPSLVQQPKSSQPPQQPPPSQPQHALPPQSQQQQQPPPQQPPVHMGNQPPQQRQTPPVSAPVPQGPPQNVSQSSHHPHNPSAMAMNPVPEVSKAHEEAEKLSSMSQSKLNPNAKEFVLNPNAKPFSPRSPSTTTPPRPHTPQTPQIPSNQPPQMQGGGHSVGFQQAMVSAAYVMAASQPFAVQPQPNRFPKRVPIGSSQRQEYTSQMQVAAATGQPILAPAPMNTQPQAALTAVPLPQNMLHQTPQPYQQYPSMPMMFRLPPTAGMPVVTAMVPTSMGLYSQATDSQQQSQQHSHQTVYMTAASLPPHQPHPAHTPGPGPQPTQPPTPQNPGGGGGPPTMPNQPPTPGPTPPQSLVYPHIGGQPSLTQHIPQHCSHTAQSPHGHQYASQNAAAAVAAAAGHHGGPGQQMATQIVVLPPNLAAAGPQMMHPSGPPPHSATAHIPSSMAGSFTPTSTGVQHMASAPHLQYLQGKQPPRFAH